MHRSTDRILTTHVGSLIRPPDLRDMIRAKDRGEPYDREAFETRLREATNEVVRQQAEAGIDIVADGELGKTGFNNYTNERLSGFERRPGANVFTARGTRRDQELFPEFYAEYWGSQNPFAAPSVCTGPITYDPTVLRRDLDNLKAALQGVSVVEAFVPAISPIRYGQNEYYASENDFLYALADAMREEYRAIVDAGFVLQIDDPGLPAQWDMFVPAISLEEYRKIAAQRVELVNHGLQGIPEDRVRYHICWGSWHGPHVTDLPLRDVADLMLQIRAQAYSIEAANPRHEHEYHIWEDIKLPEGKVLIPGVIAHTTNTVEHPELVAERLVNYARLVGRENVIGGADCGFAQGAMTQRAHPSIVWAKFRALAEGARIATRRLWG